MRRRFVSLFIISGLLLLASYSGITKALTLPLEPAIVAVKKNIYQGTYKFKFFPTVLFGYQEITDAISENRKLQNENLEIKMKLQRLERENEELRRQLGAPMPADYKIIPADVISVTRFMEIGEGENSGVATGMSVVDGNILIGRVSQTTKSRSQVILITDSNLSVPAITSRGSRGNLGGQLSEFVLFKDILQKDPLFIEDTLYTTGEGGFPRDLLIGSVVKIEGDDVAVYKRAQVKPFSVPLNLSKVYVIEEI